MLQGEPRERGIHTRPIGEKSLKKAIPRSEGNEDGTLIKPPEKLERQGLSY